ncbi:LytR/AlgR family response regulator transcription factor [Novosphingobium soli]|uniref:LytR/AlgR family response regulator transcription factor n=1 Tax=Novosphingobium soli TaxID=574956 RepID=A0ABV6CRV2_9SPHN
MIRVLLVDDEPLALDRLKAAIRPIEGIAAIATAGDGPEALEAIATGAFDLLVLDIQMPGCSGMDVARHVAAMPAPPDIVFVTAFDRFAPQAFEVEAVDYLLKPVSFDRLRLAIERVKRRRASRDAEGRAAELDLVVRALREEARAGAAPQGAAYEGGIWIPCRGGAVRVPVETIDWIEAARDYVLINTPTRSYILRATMTEVAGWLDPARFLRIHRSHIVKRAAVVSIDRPGKGVLRLVLSDGACLQVGPSYQTAVVEALGIESVTRTFTGA